MWHTNLGMGAGAQSGAGDGWVARWGSPEPPQAPRALRAGPLTLGLLGADLLGVAARGVRLVSRVGVRVRDRDWGTVPGTLSAVEVEEGDGGFAVRLRSEHRAPGLAFAWDGVVRGEPGGTLVYEMDGTVLEDSAFNRIGLCVLHAAAPCAGRPFRARGADGERAGRLPRLVGPQPIEDGTIQPLVGGFSELDLDLGDGLAVRFALSGDVFEMEDQRNWTDGSFKTYSTPVGLPVPHRLPAGARIAQTLRMEVRGANGTARPVRPARDAGAGVRLGGPTGRRLPPLGAEVDGDGHEPTEAELALLDRLAPAHLRVSVTASTAVAALRRARRVADRLGCGLEVALTLPADGRDAALDELTAALGGARDVHRAIVLQEGRPVTGPAAVAAVRARLGGSAPPLLTGTDRYFAELNRDRPAMDGLAGLAYPITPQVHDDDEDALVESLAAQADTVATARAFAAGRPVHVSPVTLKPRWNPLAVEPEVTPPGALPANVDPRQPGTFAAAWTVGSIRRLAEAGAASVTYYELTGWRGLVEREAGSPLPERFRSRPGAPYPVLWVLAEACARVGAELLAVELDDPLALEALALRRGPETAILVANLRPEARSVAIAGLPAGRAAVATLDARDPDGLAGPGREAAAGGGRLELELDAWSVARVVVGGRG